MAASVFDVLYREIAEYVERALGLDHLAERIKRSFVDVAEENITKHRPSAERHLKTMRMLAPMWRRFRSTLCCSFCLVRSPKYLLDCGHGLCRACLVICGGVSVSDEWRATIHRCPLCERLNGRSFLLRPPTTSLRILRMQCQSKHKAAAMQFLRDLQSHTGLTGWRLSDHFDVFVGSGIGEYETHLAVVARTCQLSSTPF